MKQLLLRLMVALGVILAVSALTYLMTDLLPGNAAQVIAAGANRAGDPAFVAEIAKHLNLDKPWPVRYGDWLGHLVRGDFGTSYIPPAQPVSIELQRTLPNSLQLMLLAQLVAIVVAIPIGIYSGYRPGKIVDRLATGFSFLGLAVPSFALAIFMMVILSVELHWLPTTFISVSNGGWIASLRSSVMPVAALAVGLVAGYTRLLRADLINTLQEDFVLNARAKGLPPAYILFRHALRPSLQSVLVAVAINTGALISGAIVIENIFGVDGVGILLVKAIEVRDLPTIQAIVLVICAMYVVVIVVVDVLYTVIDPRISRD